MADKYIRDLPAAAAVNNSDNLVIDQGGIAKRLPGSYYNDQIVSKVNRPITNPNGNYSELLRSKGDGKTEWSSLGKCVQDLPYAETIANSNSYIIEQNGEAKKLRASFIDNKLLGKVNVPESNPGGSNGQVLRSKGNGKTEWVFIGTPTDEQVREVIDEWLEGQNVKNGAFLEYVVVT